MRFCKSWDLDLFWWLPCVNPQANLPVFKTLSSRLTDFDKNNSNLFVQTFSFAEIHKLSGGFRLAFLKSEFSLVRNSDQNLTNNQKVISMKSYIFTLFISLNDCFLISGNLLTSSCLSFDWFFTRFTLNSYWNWGNSGSLGLNQCQNDWIFITGFLTENWGVSEKGNLSNNNWPPFENINHLRICSSLSLVTLSSIPLSSRWNKWKIL